MKIYLMTFKTYDYDQYDSFVILARNKEQALAIIEAEHPKDDKFPSVDWSKGYDLEEVDLSEATPSVLLSSFNAG